MSIFTDSLYFQFHLLAFYSQRSGRRCWHFQGKRAKKLHYFFRFVLMTVVGIIVCSTTFTYYVHKFRFFFFHFSQSTHLDRQQVCKYYCGFQSALIIMEIIFVGSSWSAAVSKQEDEGWNIGWTLDTDFDGFFAVCHFCLPTHKSSHTTKTIDDCFQE